MALTVTVRAGGGDDTDSLTYTTASFTPTGGALLLAFFGARSGSSGNVLPTISGTHSYTIGWTNVSDQLYDTGGPTRSSFSLWAAVTSGTPGSGTVTATYSATQQCAAWSVFDVDGGPVSSIGPGSGAAIIQAVSMAANGAASSGSITLASAADAANRPFSFWAKHNAEDTVHQTNWTEIDDQVTTTTPNSVETQWRSDTFETTASASWTSSNSRSGVAIEINATASGPTAAVSGVSSQVAASQGQVVKVAKAATAVCSVGATATANIRTSRGTSGVARNVTYSSATSRKVAPQGGRSSLPSVSSSTTRKVAPVSGVDSAVGYSVHTGQATVAVSGVCSLTGSAFSGVVHVGVRSGSSHSVSSAQSSSTKLIAKSNILSAGSGTTQGNIVKRGVIAGTNSLSIGFSSGLSAKKSPVLGKTFSVGVSSHSGQRIVAVSGTCSLAPVATTIVTTVRAVSGRSIPLAATQSVARKVISQGGMSFVPGISRSTTKKVLPVSTNSSLPTIARSVVLKKIAISGFSLGVSLGNHSGAATRAISARCILALISLSTTIHVSLRSGLSSGVGFSRVSVVKVRALLDTRSFGVAPPRGGTITKKVSSSGNSSLPGITRCSVGHLGTVLNSRSIIVAGSSIVAKKSVEKSAVVYGISLSNSSPQSILFTPRASRHYAFVDSIRNTPETPQHQDMFVGLR